MSEEKLRQEAVRRRLASGSPADIAEALGRTTRWVRIWVARHHDESSSPGWAQARSRAPLTSPGRTTGDVEHLILDARELLVANPQAQYGPLAIQWELRQVGVVNIPTRTDQRTCPEPGRRHPAPRPPKRLRVQTRPLPDAPRRRAGHHPPDRHGRPPTPPRRHQVQRHEPHRPGLPPRPQHHRHRAPPTRPRPCVGRALGTRRHSGRRPVRQPHQLQGWNPATRKHFSPIVAMCLDLGITPRFIPLREPWRIGIIEHFNDVWDKSSFRTATFNNLDHLRADNTAFIEFHNTRHRYSAHQSATPNEVWGDQLRRPLNAAYKPPDRLPPQPTDNR